ncbi:MAG: putative lipid II flippase FtsW [Actinobacteria bacterium]|nr:putative lipid II flippase FtsW [Actinomycetota bacterium]
MRRENALSYYGLIAFTFIIVLLGIIMISSASSIIAFAREKDAFFYLKRQIAWTSVGFIGLIFFSKVDFHRLRKISFVLAVISLILLVLVLFLGKSAGGARRWLILGGISFQPSEFAKFSMIILGADLLLRIRKEKPGRESKHKGYRNSLIFIVAINILLIILQPDFGTAFSIFLALFLLMVLSGEKIFSLFKMGIASLPVILLIILINPERIERIFTFLFPDKNVLGGGFHLNQSLIAIGSGGLYGKGFGMSRQKFFYLPAAHTDFIFAIIGEELGLVGAISVVIVFLMFTYFGMKIALRSKDLFGKVLAAGITFMIAIQAIINMGAVTGVLPITGIPLPLISFGGTSLLFTLCEIGILLNIALR